MNTVNMIMNTLKVDRSKSDKGSNKPKAESGFNDLLDKAISNSKSSKDNKSSIVENKESLNVEEIKKDSNIKKLSNENDEELKALKKLENDIKEYLSKNEKPEDGQKDNLDKIIELLSALGIIMNNSLNNTGSTDPLSIELNNEGNFMNMDMGALNKMDVYLKVFEMLAQGEDLTTMMSNSENNGDDLLLLLKLMASTDMKDFEKYLKENLNMTSEEVETVVKLLNNENIPTILKNIDKNQENSNAKIVTDAKNAFEGIGKAVESKENLDDNLSSLLGGEEENADTSTKEENVLKNIISGSSGMKNFNIRDIALSQSNKISEQPMINKNNFAEDIIKSIKYMDVNNLKELTVKVVPKELGELVIKLTIESGIMKANLNATNKEAYELLSANFKDISDKLQSNNIKIGEVNINLYEDDTTFFSDDSRKGNFNQEEKNKRAYEFQNEEEIANERESIDKNYLSYFV